MYAAIVERIVRNGFQQHNRGNIDAALKLFADDAELRFPGEHDLAARCRGRSEIAGWFRRLRRLFPTLQFEIIDVTVRGWPWRSQVLTRFIDRIEFSNQPPSSTMACSTCGCAGVGCKKTCYISTRRQSRVPAPWRTVAKPPARREFVRARAAR